MGKGKPYPYKNMIKNVGAIPCGCPSLQDYGDSQPTGLLRNEGVPEDHPHAPGRFRLFR